MLGLPTHVRQPVGDEGRELVQDFDLDGQFAGDLPTALRGATTGGIDGFRGIRSEPRRQPKCLIQSPQLLFAPQAARTSAVMFSDSLLE